MQLPEIDFSSLEFKEIGSWPLLLQVAINIATIIIVIVIVYIFMLAPKLDDLNSDISKLDETKKNFKDKYNLIINFDAYKEQMQQIQGAVNGLVEEIPATSDIPSLVDSISKLGETNNLKFVAIKIGEPKAASGFYMELPISLNIVGTYHNLGEFLSDVSMLPRIVTVGNFEIKPVALDQDPNNLGLLNINISIKTYWLASVTEQRKDAKAVDGNDKKAPNKSPTSFMPNSSMPAPPTKPAGGQ